MGKLQPINKWVAAVVVVGIVATAGVVAVSLVGSRSGTGGDGGPSTVVNPTTDPATNAHLFLSAWAASDWVALQQLISGQEGRADEALIEWWRDLHVKSVGFTTGTPQIGEGSAVVPFHATIEIKDAGTWDYDSELRLVPQDHDWVVAWSSGIIHPTLGSGDRLDLTTNWPERGLITDREGRPLVRSVPYITVGLIQERMVSRDTVAEAFDESLEISGDVIDGILDRPGVQPDWFLPVSTITREDYVDVRPALFPVPGVAFRLVDRRVPIEPGLAAPLLGTTGEVTAELLAALGVPYEAGSIVGRTGLERSFERQLAGAPTKRIVRRAVDGSVETVFSFDGMPASDLRTTLSLDAQRAAESVLNDIDLPASLVAIDIDTGEIRAAASSPADGFNRAMSGLYPPGSTFKIIVATALLESGLLPDATVSCPRVVSIAGKEFGNAALLPTTMTFESAFARSCNTAFIQLAADLDPTALAETAQRFGFGTVLNIGIAAADASFQASTDPVKNAASVIGQGDVLASPLNMASVAATAASGVFHPPKLIAGNETDASERLDPAVVANLQAMMRAVVVRGTGQAAAVEGVDVVGKTGTAEIATAEGTDSVAWFVGFADDLAFAVSVEGGASGGSTAGPIAAAFLGALEAPTGSRLLSECVAAGADWVTFQGDITRSGCSQANPILEPRRRWRTEVGISGWLNSPIVANGLVVVGSAGGRRSARDDADGVYALDLQTGERRWYFPAGNDVNGVAASGDIVIATGDEGTVWGLDLMTGAEIWSFSAGAPVFTNPLIVGDLVVVGDASGVLWALDLGGKERWHAQFDGAIRGGAASDGRLVYAVSDHGEAAAFTVDGFEMWRTLIEFEPDVGFSEEPNTTVPVMVFAAPTVADDKVIITYIVEGGPDRPALVGLDRYVGRIEWRGSDPSSIADGFANLRNSPARHGDALVFASSLSTGVQAINSKNGQAVWATETGIRCERQWASPIIVGNLIVLPRPDGAVHAFDATSGESVWRIVPADPSELAPPANCTADGQQVHDGFELHASIAVAPDGTLIVASTSQAIYAIGYGS
jgi:cell division protein FtsI/penicillin-binding protein 2/outer membrane protein assembly factor BamB